jgi:uncharacterized repeat protein (TIGR01451 family)
MAMSRPRLFAGLAVVAVCLGVQSAGPARGQAPAGDSVPPPPPASLSRDNPGPGPSELSAVAASIPAPPDTAPPLVPINPKGEARPGPTRLPPAVQEAMPFSREGKPGGPNPMPPAPPEARHQAGFESQPTAPTLGGRQEPAVSLEWVGPSAVRLGQPAGYRILVRNICPTAVHQVTLRCLVPEGASVSVSDPLPLTKGGVLTWDLGTEQPGQDRRIELQLLAAARAALDLQAAVSFTGVAAMRVQVREPKLALKLAGPAQVVLGDSATVTLTVSNPGDGPTEHVKVRAQLPEGLEHPRGRQMEVDLGVLAPQEQRTVQLVCTARAQGLQRCEAVATADGGLKASAVAPVNVVLPRIDLAATGPHLRYLERKAVYTFKATNPGSAPAGNVSVQAVVPQGMKVHAASAGGQCDATTGTVSWFVGDLPPGQSREVSVEVIPVSMGEHHVRAVATAARGLKTEAEVVTRAEGLSALLMELADADDPVEVGTDTSYEIRVTNTGSKMETNLQLTCTLPERMELRGARCAAGCRYRVDGRDVVFEPLPRLAPRADVVYRVFVRGTAPGDLRFRARIRADGLSEPVLREESTKVYGDDVTH